MRSVDLVRKESVSEFWSPKVAPISRCQMTKSASLFCHSLFHDKSFLIMSWGYCKLFSSLVFELYDRILEQIMLLILSVLLFSYSRVVHYVADQLLLFTSPLKEEAVPVTILWPLAGFVNSIVLTHDHTLYRKRLFKKDYFDGYYLRSYAYWSILLWYVPSRPRLPSNNNNTFTPLFLAITLTNLAKIGEWAS